MCMNRIAKYLSACLFFLVTLSGLIAQEVITPVAGNPTAAAYYRLNRWAAKSATADTLELPVFDDFSSTKVMPDPSIWSDADAFVNNDYCIDPVSNGVATLDAIDYRGSIYPGATFDPVSYVADHLTSLPIRLSYPPGDSIYLSFLYQPKGLGEVPEEQDSLLVDFYSPSDSLWTNVWGIPGTGLHPFRHVMIPVAEGRFLEDGFRFRFRNRASLPRSSDYKDKRGNVDHWNVDYVRLNRLRFAADTVLRDVAFISPLKSILKDLTSLPWSHFEKAKNTALDPTIKVRYRNNDTITHNVTRSLVIEEPLWDETSDPVEPTAQDLFAGEDTVVEFLYYYPIRTDRGDSAIVRLKASLRTDEFDPKANDTVIHDQLFKDYFSYDDGTPEVGYGLRAQGSAGGIVAQRYHAFEPDELGGIDIAFNQLYDSLNLGPEYYFKLMVWGDNGGVPGTILMEDEKDHLPVYPDPYPGFKRFYFSEPVPVDGTFYVGWRQYNEYLLNVGFDLNNRPEPHVLYVNYKGYWEESIYAGVIMVRPFLYVEPTGSGSRIRADRSLDIYPNPATDHVFIRYPGDDPGQEFLLDVFDSSGRLADHRIMLNESLDVSGLAEGIYYMRLRWGTSVYHAKLLINR